MKVKGPPGMGGRIGLGLAHSGINRLYQDLKGGEGSFKNDIEMRIRQSMVEDPNKPGQYVTLQQLADSHGLHKELDTYIGSTFKGMKKGLAHTLDLVTSAKDSLEDVVEGTELITLVGQAGNVVELPVGIVASIMYSGLAGALGLASGTYRFTPSGAFNYTVDTTKTIGGSVINAIPILGSFVELSTNVDDKRPRIADAFAKKVHKKLAKRIKGGKYEISPENLESRIKSSSGMPRSGSTSSSGRVEYGSHAQDMPGRAYSGDFAPEMARAYGRA